MIKPDAKESRVKDVCKALLKAHQIYYFMPATGGFGRSGVADIVGCYKGRFFSIECKAPIRRNNLSELQKVDRDKVQAAGGRYFTAYDDATIALIEAWILET